LFIAVLFVIVVLAVQFFRNENIIFPGNVVHCIFDVSVFI